MILYHYSPKINLQAILQNGLVCSTKCLDTQSIDSAIRIYSEEIFSLRQNAIYFYLDKQPYSKKETIEIQVDFSIEELKECYIANWDYSQTIAAYLKKRIVSEQEHLKEIYRHLPIYVQEYIRSIQPVQVEGEELASLYDSVEVLYTKEINSKRIVRVR